MDLRFAVIGNPIAHSLSPLIHQAFAKACGMQLSYERILGEDENFEAQICSFFSSGGRGMNVTLPFKERAYVLAEVKHPACEAAKAANTLWLDEGQLQADNTDGSGLVSDLGRYIDLQGKSVLVLGAGGACRGIIAPLQKAGIASLLVANRQIDRAEAVKSDFPLIEITTFADLSGEYDLIINATSASLAGTGLQLPDSLWASKPFCYDLAYNRSEATVFVKMARDMGCQAVDGLGMLVEQAACAFEIWLGIKPETESVITSLRT